MLMSIMVILITIKIYSFIFVVGSLIIIIIVVVIAVVVVGDVMAVVAYTFEISLCPFLCASHLSIIYNMHGKFPIIMNVTLLAQSMSLQIFTQALINILVQPIQNLNSMRQK